MSFQEEFDTNSAKALQKLADSAGPPPDTLHELVGLAIRDCKSLDRKAFFPEAQDWHEAVLRYDEKEYICHGCFAGAVMAGTLAVPVDITCEAWDFSRLWAKALAALDLVRAGEHYDAYEELLGAHGKSYCDISDTIAMGLHAIAAPPESSFRGWDEFDEFLHGMEYVAAEFRKLGV